MIHKLVFILLAFITINYFAEANTFAADDIVSISAEGLGQGDNPAKARSDSLKEALNKGALQIISGLIGEIKFDKNITVIRSKILPQSSKFIQFYKASEPELRGADTVTTVNMKISVQALKDVLAQEGLLYQSDGPATILPIIRFVERRDGGRQFRWWLEESTAQNNFLRDLARSANQQLDHVFRSKNFYVIDPVMQHYVQWLPSSFRNDPLSLEDWLWVGEFLKAQMVIQGEAAFESGSVPGSVRLSVKLTAYHSANGRVVGEISRTVETPTGDWDAMALQASKRAFADASRDLGTQVFDAWTRGTLGATMLKLTVRGNFNYQDLESFKKQMTTKIADVKTIRERAMEKNQATFEIDAAGGLGPLAKRLEVVSFEGFKVSVDSMDTDRVVLRWSKAQ